MMFEEEFPSLVDCLYDDGIIECTEKEYGFLQSDIQKYTIDKQRVKEVIAKLDKELDSWYDRSTADWVILYFKKELGLEDD